MAQPPNLSDMMTNQRLGCRKGSRDCAYPEQTSSSKPTAEQKSEAPTSAVQDSGSSSGESEVDEAEDAPKVETPEDAALSNVGLVSATSEQAAFRKEKWTTTRYRSTGSSKSPQTQSHSPSTNESRSRSTTVNSSGQISMTHGASLQEVSPRSHISKDPESYLDWHRQHITFYHYFFKYNASEFVHSILIDAARVFDPLLYAVVAFAAFHRAIGQPNGKIQDFLSYYNKSLSSLRKSLQSNQAYNDTTVLAVLQLASLEVSLARKA